MIKDPKIVQKTRKVRYSISARFGNDPDRYIDHLLSLVDEDEAKSKPRSDDYLRAEETNACRDRC